MMGSGSYGRTIFGSTVLRAHNFVVFLPFISGIFNIIVTRCVGCHAAGMARYDAVLHGVAAATTIKRQQLREQ